MSREDVVSMYSYNSFIHFRGPFSDMSKTTSTAKFCMFVIRRLQTL